MALTRPRLGQLITNVTSLTDNLTVINSAANQANVDVGFIFNRTDGVGSVPNVALYWNETTKGFTFATTTDSGDVAFSNVNASSWANISAGNIKANAIYFANGTPWSTGTASVSGINSQLQYNNNGVLAGANVSFFSSNLTLVANANITASGSIITTGNIVGGGVRSTTSSTPPVSPTVGDVWYNSSTDQIYRYTQDSSSQYWLNVYAPAVSSNSTVVTSSTYSNSNVASYLVTNTGNIAAGNITATGTIQYGSGQGGLVFRTLAGGTGAAIYNTNIVPSAQNYAMTTDGASVTFNAPTGGGIYSGINNTIVTTVQAGNLSVTGNLITSGYGYFPGAFQEASTASGVFVGNTGSAGGLTPRVAFFNGNTTQNWQIDNYYGAFRWFTPGVSRMTLDGNTNQLTVQGNVSSTANVIASAAIISGNITASGIYGVSTPNIPAFRITGNGGTITATTTVSGGYMVVDFNQGSYLNTSTGTFTAPIAGLYQVNLLTRTSTNANGAIIQAVVQKNGSTNVIMIEYGSNTSMNHTGGSTVVKLAVGDTLQFKVLVGTISFDGNDNWSVAFLG
jgi:hypothetical protein